MILSDLALNSLVIATNELLTGKQPLMNLVIDGDGDLQVWGVTELSEDNVRLVSLEDILRIDDSIGNIPYSRLGTHFIKSDNTWKRID